MSIINEVEIENINKYKSHKKLFKAVCDNCKKEYLTGKYAIKNKNTLCSDDCWHIFQLKQNSDNFIENAKKIHGDLYDYSKSNYTGALNKIIIICKKHGEFEQIANNHLQGRGCKKCSKEYIGLVKKQKTIENFYEIASKIHNDFYDYSQININDFNEKRRVKIICPIHGEFEQRIDAHLKGQVCKKCQRNKSKGEKLIQKFLIENNIKYEPQKRFIDCKNKKQLPFDFYLSEYNTCIEFNGKQHYEPVNFDRYTNKNLDYIKIKITENFNQQIINDKIKKEYCEKNKISLIIIPYWKINKIEKILRKKLNEF